VAARLHALAAVSHIRSVATIFVPSAIALMLLGCGGSSAEDVSPEHPQIVDWREGTVNGIGLGSATAEVVDAFGAPERRGFQNQASPVGEDFYEIGGPTSFGLPYRKRVFPDQLGYRNLTMFTARDRVYAWVTTSERAQTREGVGVGDGRMLVERRYPRANCYTANDGTDYATFPLCAVNVCTGRTLYFGADPIRSIWLVAKRTGLSRCANPETPTGRAD
jgi:hypothetical protein